MSGYRYEFNEADGRYDVIDGVNVIGSADLPRHAKAWAAVPELTAALRDCVEWLESVPLGEAPLRSVAAARAILKKIEGDA
jgi:hypothetical protein